MGKKSAFDNPRILAILTVVFWSFSSLLAKLISIKSPYLLFCLSFSFALIIYIVYAYRNYGKELFRQFRYIRVKYFLIGLSGYYAVWVGNTESFRAFDSASETTVLNYTWLIFTVFFTETIFRRKKQLNLKSIIEYTGVFAAFVSVYVLAVKGRWGQFDIGNVEGIFWGLFGGMAYGFFSAYSGTIPKKKQPVFLISAILSGLLAMLLTSYFTSGNLIAQAKQLTWRQIGLTAALGILVDALGYIMWTRSLTIARITNLNVSKVVSVIFLLPLTSLVIISLSLKEYTLFEPYFLLSLLFLLVGSFLAQKSEWIAKLIVTYTH